MTLPSRLIAAACALSLILGLGACTRLRDVKGYIADDSLVKALQPGVDNKNSVQKTLGRPTSVSEVDPNRWYYVSQVTRQLAFFKPKPELHQVLVVNFDAKGNLASTQKIGREQIVSVSASGDKTPTRGKEASFWDNLFGDIGRYAPAGAGGGGPQ